MGASNAVKRVIMHATVQILLQALNQEVEVDQEEVDQEVEVQLLCHILRMVSHLLQHVIQFVLFMVVKSYRELQIVKRAEVEFTMAVHCDLVRIWIKAVIAISMRSAN